MKSKVQLGLSILVGLMMINSGLNKIFNYIPTPPLEGEMAVFTNAMISSKFMMPLLAVVEVLGAILLILPKTRALGAIVLLPVIVGIFLFHIAIAPEGTIIGVILLAFNIWVIYDHRAKYMPMINA